MKIKSILAPRTLFFLNKLEVLDFANNPFVEILKSKKIDVKRYILSLLLECSLKVVNGVKLIRDDFKKAKEFYKDKRTGTMSKDVLKRTLLMEIDEGELLEFLNEPEGVSASVAIEEVKELVEEEN